MYHIVGKYRWEEIQYNQSSEMHIKLLYISCNSNYRFCFVNFFWFLAHLREAYTIMWRPSPSPVSRARFVTAIDLKHVHMYH
jgi:hypothetical protein